MDNVKQLYIDLYKTNFSEDGLTITDNKHLSEIDICTDVSVQEVVFKLRQLIFEKYNDGLSIKAEEFDSFCYLNVFVFFGEDVSTLIEYLESISLERVTCIDESSLDRDDEEVTFFSIDYVEPENIKEYELIMKAQGLDSEKYLLGQSAFERGAGDYHQIIVFVLEGIALGALSEFGRRSFKKFVDQFGEYQRPSLVKFNPNVAIDHVTERSRINKQDLRVTRTSPTEDNNIEIKVTSRYKDFILIYEKKLKSITHYEETSKSQTLL